MIYPAFLKKDNTIGITAPSAGVGHKIEDFDKALTYLKQQGWKIKETESVRNDARCSTTAKGRAEELVSLFKDPDTDFVMCATGGDFLFEILPYVDFKEMQKHPKFLMGASDPTGILYPFTTLYDVSTIYGCNAGSYDISPVPQFIKDNLDILQGKNIVQYSSDKKLSKPPFLADSPEYDTSSQWEGTVEDLHVQGRCIGGCIDVLKDLIGTRYDGTHDFINRYKEDGFIWYFDNFSQSAEVFYRTLLQMEYAGWFEYTKAIIVGRVCFPSSETEMTYEEAITKAFKDIPVLYEADIGHTIPHMTMINGAIMDLNYHNHKASLSFTLK